MGGDGTIPAVDTPDVATTPVVFDTNRMPSDVLARYNQRVAEGNARYDAGFRDHLWDKMPEEFKEYVVPPDEKEKEEKEEPKEGPPPTAADPAPPEGIPDEAEAIAVCTSPDVCKTPIGSSIPPIPYQVYGTANNDSNYSPNVFYNGLAAKRFNSQFTTTYGDEPGTAKGVKSGTVGDTVDPTSHSTIVRINGEWAIRHRDTCTLNNGNCPGEYIFVEDTSAKQAPDGNDQTKKDSTPAPDEEKPWYEDAWDGVTDAYDWTNEKLGEAGQAIGEFDRNNGRIVTRGIGGLQAAGGALEAVAGAALAGVGGAASATGVGAAPGVPAMIGGGLLAVNGYDNFSTGLKQLWTGEGQTTAIASAAGGIASGLGASPETAQTVTNIAGMAQGAVGAAGTISAGLKAGGRIGSTTVKGGSSAADDVAEAGVETAAKAETRTAVESGEQGLRVTDENLLVINKRGVRISKTYKRPSFRKKTKNDAWDSAKDAEGSVHDPKTGKTMKRNEPWDMGHKEGYEFWKHQESAQSRGISRQQFIDEYNNANHYRPELPSSNRSHSLEAPDDLYYGD